MSASTDSVHESLQKFYRRTAELHERVRQSRPKLLDGIGPLQEPVRIQKLLALSEQMNNLKQMFENDQSEKRHQEVMAALHAMKIRTDAVSEKLALMKMQKSNSVKTTLEKQDDHCNLPLREHQLILYAGNVEILNRKECEYFHNKYEGILKEQGGGADSFYQGVQDMLQSRHSEHLRDSYQRDVTDLHHSSVPAHELSQPILHHFDIPKGAELVIDSSASKLKNKYKSAVTQTDALVLCDHCKIPISAKAVQIETQNFMNGNITNGSESSSAELPCVPQHQHNISKIDAAAGSDSLSAHDMCNLTSPDKNVKSDKEAFELGYADHVQRNSLKSEGPTVAGSKLVSHTYNSELFNKSSLSNESSGYKSNYDSSSVHIKDTQFPKDVSSGHSNTDDWVLNTTPDKEKHSSGQPVTSNTEGLASQKLISDVSSKAGNIYENQPRKGSRGSVNQEFSFLEADSKASSASGRGYDNSDVSKKLQKSVQDMTVGTLKDDKMWKGEESNVISSASNDSLLSTPEKNHHKRSLRRNSAQKVHDKDSVAVLSSQQSGAKYASIVEVDKSATEPEKEAAAFPVGHNGNEQEVKSVSCSVSSASETDANDDGDDDDEDDPGVPLGATDAFKKLIGHISVGQKATEEYEFSQPDFQDIDEIEEELSAAIRERSAKSPEISSEAGKVSAEQNEPSSAFRKKSIFSLSDSPSKRQSVNPATRYAGVISKSAMKALGWSPELEQKASLPSSAVSKDQEEDSDEFDFYD